MQSSHIISAKCDCCGRDTEIKYNVYNKIIERYGDYYCIHCAQKRTLTERQNNIYKKIIDFCKEHSYLLITEINEIFSRESYIEYICPKHGVYKTKATSILQGKICYQCSRENAGFKKWQNNLFERQNVLFGKLLSACNEKGYRLITKLEDLKGYEYYVKYECPIHGIKTMKASNLLSGKGCPDCWKSFVESRKKHNNNDNKSKYRSQALLPDDVERRINLLGGKLLNKSEYINNSTKNLIILCPRCGQEFKTSLKHFEQHGGQSCSDCYKKESVGERKIREYLEKNNIDYVPQYWFDDCRDINPLPFDFYIEKLNMCIEFDGKQHFEPTHFFNCSYNKIQAHDQIKNKYCLNNGIHLIRIPYWKMNKITDILDNELINNSHEDIV